MNCSAQQRGSSPAASSAAAPKVSPAEAPSKLPPGKPSAKAAANLGGTSRTGQGNWGGGAGGTQGGSPSSERQKRPFKATESPLRPPGKALTAAGRPRKYMSLSGNAAAAPGSPLGKRAGSPLGKRALQAGSPGSKGRRAKRARRDADAAVAAGLDPTAVAKVLMAP